MTDIQTANNMEQKQLNTSIMIMQCIGILSVVLGHAEIGLAEIPNILNLAFPYYSWHMPFFIFVSGYLFNRKRSLGRYVLGKCRTLLIPALVVNFICGLFSMTLRHLGMVNYGKEITFERLFIMPFTTGYQFYINVSLWFIFALFTIELFSCLLDRLVRGKGDIAFTLIALVVSVLCCVRVFFDHAGTRNSYFLAALRFGYLIFFFWLGILYKSHLEKHLKRFLNLKTAMILLCGMCAFYGITGYVTTYNTRSMKFTEITVPNGFWVPIVIPLIGIAFFLSISYHLSPYLKNSRTIRWISTNSRYIVYWHQLCFILFSFLLYALFKLNVLPKIEGFSHSDLYKKQYYVSKNNFVAMINVIFSIVMPIWVCTSLKKIKRKWVAALVGIGIVALVIGYLWLVHSIIS